jgi:ribosomal-protein-alanine N-acetyltransferase
MLNFNFSSFPTLVTERLTLRRIEDNDIPELFDLRSNNRVMEFVDRPLATSLEDISDFLQRINDSINNNVGITWAIALKDDQKLIGTIGFWKIMKEHYRAEIGFLLNIGYQRKGIMQEALSTVINFGFETMKLHSIEANVNPANVASIKLLERKGFIREAYFKENFYFEGKFLDSAIYSLINHIK